MPGQNGTEVLLQFAGSVYSGQQGTNLNVSRDQIEVTTKDSTGSFKEYIQGEIGGTGSLSGLVKLDDSSNVNLPFDKLVSSDSSGTLIWGDLSAGGKHWTSTANISNLTMDAPQNDAITYSCDFQLTGTIAEGVS